MLDGGAAFGHHGSIRVVTLLHGFVDCLRGCCSTSGHSSGGINFGLRLDCRVNVHSRGCLGGALLLLLQTLLLGMLL